MKLPMTAGMTILLAIVAVGASATTVNRRTLLGSVAAAAAQSVDQEPLQPALQYLQRLPPRP